MSGRIYDLSMPFTRDMPTYFFWKNWHHLPFFATFTDLTETSLGPATGEGFVSLVAFLTHTGTHMDAPRHFRRGAWYLHEIPPDRFLGEGPVLPVPKGPNEDITVQDLEATEMEVRAGDLVVIDTGWHRQYKTPGQDREGAHYYFTQHPGLCTESAQWLLDRLGTQSRMLREVIVRALPVLPRRLVLPVPSRVDDHQIARADLHLGRFQILYGDVLIRALGHWQDRPFTQEAIGRDFMQIPRAASKVPRGIHVGAGVREKRHQRDEPLAGRRPQAGFCEVCECGEEW